VTVPERDEGGMIYQRALADARRLRPLSPELSFPLIEVAEAASDFMEDPGETNEKVDRLNDALAVLHRA
jgi:hypothetical protein